MTKAQRQQHQDRMNDLHATAQAIVDTGRCPDCSSGLHRNLTITGWWQCDRFGATGFRRDTTGQQCSFQTFTA